MLIACSEEAPLSEPEPAAEEEPEVEPEAEDGLEPDDEPEPEPEDEDEPDNAGEDEGEEAPAAEAEGESEAAAEPAQAEPAQAEPRAKAEAGKAEPSAKPEPAGEAKPAAEAKPAGDDAKVAVVAGPCGEKGQPMCPLQAWMEKNLQGPFDDGDLAKVAANLRKVKGFSPDPSWNGGDKGWATSVDAGIQAAQAGDSSALKQSCKSCHKAWRKKYKAEHRKRKI
jgi:hypothetical protein